MNIEVNEIIIKKNLLSKIWCFEYSTVGSLGMVEYWNWWGLVSLFKGDFRDCLFYNKWLVLLRRKRFFIGYDEW